MAAPTAVRIEEFDPKTADDDHFRARYALVCAAGPELRPEDPIQPFEQFKDELLNMPSYYRPKFWTAWDADNGAVGSAVLPLSYTETNRHLAQVNAFVLPEYRRGKVGTALLARAVEAASIDGRTLLSVNSIDGHAGDAFCEAMGFEKKATERKSRLTLADIDRPMLEGWVARAAERASDYELIGFEGRCPDDLLDDFVALTMVMNTAPRDDLEMEDWVETPERYRENEELALEQGYSWWRLIARHKATGQLAGYTEFFFAPYTDEVAWQEATGVRPEHRDRGLARWLKAANCLRLLDERPEVRYVDTWNAFSNGPMLGINIAMGFQLVRGFNNWQAPTDRVASAVKERLGG